MNMEIENIIKQLNLLNDKEFKNLARAIEVESLKNPRKIVELVHSKNEDDSKKAFLVLNEIGDLAMTPILESINYSDPNEMIRDTKMAVSIQLDSQNRIVKILEEMLNDKRDLDEGVDLALVEEVPPSRRVCDEAYIMMRHLFALEEDEERLSINTYVFLEMSDEERDSEIKRLRETKKWILLVKKVYPEEDSEGEDFEDEDIEEESF